jgi:hypothetical protein
MRADTASLFIGFFSFFFAIPIAAWVAYRGHLPWMLTSACVWIGESGWRRAVAATLATTACWWLVDTLVVGLLSYLGRIKEEQERSNTYCDRELAVLKSRCRRTEEAVKHYDEKVIPAVNKAVENVDALDKRVEHLHSCLVRKARVDALAGDITGIETEQNRLRMDMNSQQARHAVLEADVAELMNAVHPRRSARLEKQQR